MQFKKPFLLFITSIVVISIFGFSIWYQWNTDQKLAQQRIPEITPIAEFNHGAPWIRGIAISPVNPNLIASVGERNIVKVWDRNSPNAKLQPNTDYSDIRSISFSPDNRFFASVGSYGYTIWTLPEWHIYCDVRAQYSSGKLVSSGDKNIHTGGYTQIFSDLAFSPDGKMYAVADLGPVTLWSIENATPIALLSSNGFVITFSQDGSTLVGGGIDGVVRLWDVGVLNEK